LSEKKKRARLWFNERKKEDQRQARRKLLSYDIEGGEEKSEGCSRCPDVESD